jgi:hypothetical protein
MKIDAKVVNKMSSALRAKTVPSNLHHVHVSLFSKSAHSVLVLRRNSGALAMTIFKVLNLACRTNIRLPMDRPNHDCPIVTTSLALRNQWLFYLLNVPF